MNLNLNDYNIIASDCVGGYLYRDYLKKQYETPFIWTNLICEDYISLINNYDKINFENFQVNIAETTRWENQLPQDTKVCYVRVDNCFNLYYTHHLYGNHDNIYLSTDDDNRYIYKNIVEFVAKRYAKQAKRMVTNNKPPLFILLDWDFKLDDMKHLLSIKHNYKQIIISPFVKNLNFENFDAYNRTNYGGYGQRREAKFIYDTYSK